MREAARRHGGSSNDNAFSALKTPGEKAGKFLTSAVTLDPNLIDEFVKDGKDEQDEQDISVSPSKMRRGTLTDLSALLGSVHESQHDLLEACRQAREDAADVEYRAEEDLRRLSYTESFMKKMRKVWMR